RAAPEQRHQNEIGAVMAVFDRRQVGRDHALGLVARSSRSETRQSRDRVRLAMRGDFVERLGDARRERRRRRSLALGMADLDTEDPRGGESVYREVDMEM